MRIVFFSHSSSVENIGGAEHALLDLMDRWSALDQNAEFLVISRAPVGKLQPQLDQRGIPWQLVDFEPWVHGIPFPERQSQFRMFDGNSAAVLKAIESLEEFRPDFAFSNTTVAPWGALAAWQLNIPHVWWLHEFIPEERFELGIQYAYEDISQLSDVVLTSSQALANFVNTWIATEQLVVCYPLQELEQIQGRIHNSATRYKQQGLEAQGQITAVQIGQFSEAKGQWNVLEALRQLREENIVINIVFVGFVSPEDRIRVNQFLEEHEMAAQVSFTGEIDETFEVITSADIGIIASPIEGFGRAAVEFMSAGVAVIGTSGGATPELIVDGVTGQLVSPGSVQELADALRKYWEETDLLRVHGEAAKLHAESEIFSRNTPEKALVKVFNEMKRGAQNETNQPHIVESLELVGVNLQEYFDLNTHDFLNSRNLQYQFGKWITHPASQLRNLLLMQSRQSQEATECELRDERIQEIQTELETKLRQLKQLSSTHGETAGKNREVIIPILQALSLVDDYIQKAQIENGSIISSRDFRVGRVVFGPIRKVRRAFNLLPR